MKKIITSLVAALASAAGAVFWWNRRLDSREHVAAPEREDMSASSLSLSAQPHRRTRLVPPTPTRRGEVPPPDSAEEGRTPFYFAPGEALLCLLASGPVGDEPLREAAAQVGATHLPFPDGPPAYPVPNSEGWFTVLRLRWNEGNDYEGTVARFAELETQVNTGIAGDGWRVATWMPNWLGTLAATDDGPGRYTPGGPGSYPRPVPAPTDGRLALTDPPFLHEWRAASRQPVTLAILDAFPDADALEGASLPPALAPLAARLRERPQPMSLDGSPHYATFRTGKPFDMSDHGLVTTWLATEVIGEEAMAHVTLEPVRVATAAGVCSAADAIAGLAPLVQRARQGETIVALLAFAIGMMDIVPPRLRLYEEHYEALRLACLALSEAGGTLLGAAGNDASGLQHPPRTRRPAVFRSVIEVTAGQLEQGDLALYANQAKALSLFGGEASLLYEIVDNLPALAGPAVGPTQRSGHEQEAANESGWVAWAGTSFAAALAAGLAVLLRGGTPSMKMWDVRTELRKVATDRRNPGNVPFVDLVRPYTGDAV